MCYFRWQHAAESMSEPRKRPHDESVPESSPKRRVDMFKIATYKFWRDRVDDRNRAEAWPQSDGGGSDSEGGARK